MEENIQNNDLQYQTNDTLNQQIDKDMQSNQTPQPRSNTLGIIALVIACLGLIVGIVLIKVSSDNTVKVKAEKVIQSGNMKIAYIDTDTIMAKYQMAVDMQKELQDKQNSISNSLKQKYTSLQREEQEYLKTGDKLTLTQQQAKEKEFKQREQQLSQQMQEQPAQFQEEVARQNEKLLNAVLAFVKDYNSKHEKYNIILSKSRLNGPTLYIDESMDITDEIVKGLNEEYAQYKKNK